MMTISVSALACALLLASATAESVKPHAPIAIQSNNDFANCSCVMSGMGTQANPYVIGPWAISTNGGIAVSVDGTNLTSSFVLYNLEISGNSSGTDTGILLNHINPSGTQTIIAEIYGVRSSIQNANVGILVENSSYVVLDGAGENSSYVSVEGWQLSANGADHAPDYVGLDPGVQYWGVGGIRFFGVSNSLIDHNSANNDTNVSYTLFASSSNRVTNNTADYPFTHNILIADGSSYNTVTGNVVGTADFINIMVADPLPGTSTLTTYGASHDNVISNNVNHNSGPNGHEKDAGIVPAFLGGIVILNGSYNNQIVNNQGTGANLGPDLVWAQAVPNANTPIGVTNYPPALNCNVTASEGGGGVSNLNGNVWRGNTYKTIASCLPAQ